MLSKKSLIVISALLSTPSVVSAQSVQFQFGTGPYRYEGTDPRAHVEGKRASCEVYARMAIVQTQANQQFRCGFQGPRWTIDPQPHFRWCRWAPRPEVFSEFKERAQGLQQCFDNLGDFDEGK